MSAPKPNKQRPANPQKSKTVKASIVVDSQLNVRWATAAAMAGMDKGRFAALAIEEACRGIVIIDRRVGGKSSHPGSLNDRQDGANQISSDDEKAA